MASAVGAYQIIAHLVLTGEIAAQLNNVFRKLARLYILEHSAEKTVILGLARVDKIGGRKRIGSFFVGVKLQCQALLDCVFPAVFFAEKRKVSVHHAAIELVAVIFKHGSFKACFYHLSLRVLWRGIVY